MPSQGESSNALWEGDAVPFTNPQFERLTAMAKDVKVGNVVAVNCGKCEKTSMQAQE